MYTTEKGINKVFNINRKSQRVKEMKKLIGKKATAFITMIILASFVILPFTSAFAANEATQLDITSDSFGVEATANVVTDMDAEDDFGVEAEASAKTGVDDTAAIGVEAIAVVFAG